MPQIQHNASWTISKLDEQLFFFFSFLNLVLGFRSQISDGVSVVIISSHLGRAPGDQEVLLLVWILWPRGLREAGDIWPEREPNKGPSISSYERHMDAHTGGYGKIFLFFFKSVFFVFLEVKVALASPISGLQGSGVQVKRCVSLCSLDSNSLKLVKLRFVFYANCCLLQDRSKVHRKPHWPFWIVLFYFEYYRKKGFLISYFFKSW